MRARPGPATLRSQGFGLEAMEPRILLSADITYGSVTTPSFSITDGAAISNYVVAPEISVTP